MQREGSTTQAFARRYRLGERIAVGGTAEVFRAELIESDGEARQVVVKRILPQFARDERFRRLFLEEARLAETLAHPGIVRVLDHGQLTGELGESCYIALEPVEGRDLASLLSAGRRAERPMPLAIAALLTQKVAEALQFIHAHHNSEGTPLQIVHRDVSPQNILVSYGGAVKLTDFGIAKSAIREERTVDGTLRGKIDYMAPEQAQSGATVDQRADIFALGCVLYELVDGVPPFRDDNELKTLDRVRQCKPRRAVAEVSAPPPLLAVLERALAREPADRYAAASEMAADLGRFVRACQPAPSAAALGQWTRDVERASTPQRSSADDAVARLLGGGGDDDEPLDVAPESDEWRPSTSVFAVSGVVAAAEELEAAEDVAPDEAVAPAEELAAAEDIALLSPDEGGAAPPPLPLDAPGARGVVPLAAPDVGHTTAEVVPPEPGRSRRLPLTIAVVVGVAALAGASGWLLSSLDRDGGDTGGSRSATGSVAPPRLLAVSASPTGAELLVDGRSRGVLPQRIVLPSEPVTLTIRHAGYQSVERVLGSADTRRELHVTLKKAAASAATKKRRRRPRHRRRYRRGSVGYLTINTLPWSRVYLDGRFIGNTPLVKRRVRAGSRRVQLRAPSGALRRSFVAVIPRGRTRSYTFDLTKKR